jgi:hypothetical protein
MGLVIDILENDTQYSLMNAISTYFQLTYLTGKPRYSRIEKHLESTSLTIPVVNSPGVDRVCVAFLLSISPSLGPSHGVQAPPARDYAGNVGNNV